MNHKSVQPKKSLGQHFLTDLSIARRIADTVDAFPDLPVLEVGPGMGVMTQFLMPKPRQLKVVEIDIESVSYLRRNFPELEDSIIEDDFLKMHLDRVFDGQPFVLTGNYPYNISSQIFFRVLDHRDLIPGCTGMIQKEVAERLAASPGSKAYGILSVLIQAWYKVDYLFTVEPNVFNPPPKVRSAVIRMTRNDIHDLGCDERLFKRVVKTAFGQRRKMLRVSLKPLFAELGLPASLPAPPASAGVLPAGSQPPAPTSAGVLPPTGGVREGPVLPPTGGVREGPDLTRRPEQLSIADFVALTNALDPARCGA